METAFSRSLSLLRKEKHLSQRTVAKDLGISQALLSHYENGVREPGLLFVKKACDYYRVSADFLLGRSMSRDGATIGPDEIYDPTAQRDNVLHGSIMATLNKKLLMNSVGMLFDLLGKTGKKEAIQAAANYLSTAFYTLFRLLYRADGKQDEQFFSVSTNNFISGLATADMIYAEADYVNALSEHVRNKGNFPPMSNDALQQAYPGPYQSVLQIIHTMGERVNHNMDNRWQGK